MAGFPPPSTYSFLSFLPLFDSVWLRADSKPVSAKFLCVIFRSDSTFACSAKVVTSCALLAAFCAFKFSCSASAFSASAFLAAFCAFQFSCSASILSLRHLRPSSSLLVGLSNVIEGFDMLSILTFFLSLTSNSKYA